MTRRTVTGPLLAVLVLCASAALAQSGAAHGDCRFDWQPLTEGIDYRAITCLGDSDDLDVHAVRLDAESFMFDVADVTNGSFAAVEADKRKATFVMNANFFDKDRTPIGVVVRAEGELQPPSKSTWQSIFLVDEDGDPAIIKVNEWSKYQESVQIAVQAGPRIVVKGHANKVNKGYSAARAGVCIQRDGELVFFATPQDRKFDMWEIARIAQQSESSGGLGCYDAMLFDGGHSTQMFVAGDETTIRIDGDPVPVFVFATKK